MTLWLLLMVLCSAAAVAVSVPLIRRYEKGENLSAAKAAAIYEDQAKEIVRDLEAGTINAAEAEAAKKEVQKRLAQAGKDIVHVRPISPMWRAITLALCAGAVILGSASLYGLLGNPDLPSYARAQPTPEKTTTADERAAQVKDLIIKLQARLKANPKEAEGWRMLGWAQFNAERYAESAEAYGKALELAPENLDYKSAYAEALVQSAQGIVTPKAQELFSQVLAKEPKDVRARYYDALGHEQSGDQAGALDRWVALLADTPADAGWRDDVRERIASLGKALGRDVSAALSTAAPAASAEQATLIKGMVERLATRLKESPKDLEGWQRLMMSYTVLKEPEKAGAALTDALASFAGDADAQATLKAKAAEIGIKPAP